MGELFSSRRRGDSLQEQERCPEVQGASHGRGQASVKTLLNVPHVNAAALLHWWQVKPLKSISTKDGPRPCDEPCTFALSKNAHHTNEECEE